MLATCLIPCPLRTASEYFINTYLNYLNFLYKKSDTFIRMAMSTTCRITWPLRTAPQLPNEYFIYTYLNSLDFYINIVILFYARTCWPHAVSNVRCAPQVLI